MTALLEIPPPMSTEDMTFARRFKELTAGETQQSVARRLGYTTGRVGQVQRGEKPSREFVERLAEAYRLDRDEWLRYAGLKRQEVVEERDSRIARLAADMAVEETLKRLLGDRTMETLEQEFIRRALELQERYGVTPRLFLAGGPGGLTRERLEASLRVIERRMAEEAEAVKGDLPTKVDRGSEGFP